MSCDEYPVQTKKNFREKEGGKLTTTTTTTIYV